MGQHFQEIVRRRPLAVLLFLCFVAWLPGFFTLPPLDRDESRFAQASKQMLETGDFVDIRLGEEVRYAKPAGIYWMQAITTAVLGQGARDRIWTYRVPSLLGAFAAVAGTFWLASVIAGAETGFWAGLLLGFSALLMSEAKIAKTDAVLLATIVAAQAIVMRAYVSARAAEAGESPSLRLALFGWAAFGLGVLVKGPVILLVCGATILALSLWDRDLGWLKRLHAFRGAAVALAIVLPWVIAIGVASHGLFFQKSLGGDFAAKLVGEQETHGAPPGYFALLSHATFWPASFALLPGLVLGVLRRKQPAIRFLLVWTATTWIMFEVTPTKLPHYILPAYPALAVLGALWLTDTAPETLALRFARLVSRWLFVLVAGALAVFLLWAPTIYGGGTPTWWMYSGAVGGGIVALLALTLPKEEAGRQACLSAFLIYAVAGFGTVPRLPALWLSQRMAEAVACHAEPGDPPVVTAGYAEPSIVFLLGTATGLDDGPKAGAAAVKSGGLALIEAGEQAKFLASVQDGGGRAEALEDIDGLNYSRGRATRMTLYRVTPGSR